MSFEIESGIEIDAKKFLEWSEPLDNKDVGALMKLIAEAIDNNDDEFLRNFHWIGKRIMRVKDMA